MTNNMQGSSQIDAQAYPWWLIYTFDNPLRRLIHDPDKLLGKYIKSGQTAIDLGCGMGYFTIPMARLVGATGQVIAVDLQKEVLQVVERRAEHAKLLERIRLHRCQANTLGLSASADFVLAFWMVHEVRNQKSFLQEVRGLLKPRGRFLFVEPRFHVTASAFQATLALASVVALKPCAEPKVAFSQAVLFAAS